MILRRLCTFVVCIFLTGCQAPIATANLPTQTTAIISPTATRDWFPSTATPDLTPTSLINSAQTPPISDVAPPAPGKALIEDPFRADQWYILAPSGGRIALQEGILSMATDNKKLFFEANSKLVLPAHFFLQINVELSTCSPNDYYSLSFWKGSNLGTYVLDFNCQGQMRLRNIQESGSKLLQDWMGVRKLAPLPPTNNLIGIWAIADRVDIFANNQLQYEFITNPSNGGGFSLALNTSGDGLSAFSFSQLGIFEP